MEDRCYEIRKVNTLRRTRDPQMSGLTPRPKEQDNCTADRVSTMDHPHIQNVVHMARLWREASGYSCNDAIQAGKRECVVYWYSI